MVEKYISDKPVVKILFEICLSYGVEHVIISPGSRNAPLIISFPGCGQFKCLSITDERSAGYFALGLAKSTQHPVIIACTSGTAALNYSPAVAEAYYQRVPLIVITADRPSEWINQADGQTIGQDGIYRNFIRFECRLPEDIYYQDDEWHVNRMLNEAFQKAEKTPGPVHINIPFREPLYGKTAYIPEHIRKIEFTPKANYLPENEMDLMIDEINRYEKVMVLIGSETPNEVLQNALSLMALKNVVVMVETLSNLNDKLFINCTDRIVSTFSEEEYSMFSPELLITFDGQVLSRMIKKVLRNAKPKHHWHITNDETIVDTYLSLTRIVKIDAAWLIPVIESKMNIKSSAYIDTWQKRALHSMNNHNDFISNIPWCDLNVFKILSSIQIPSEQVHLGNSTPVRYAQLFDWKGKHEWFANRGTSGIDGCVGVAAGFAFGSGKSTLLITGDLSFLYDTNGLWHNYLPETFRIIVINNGGGGIFRFIQGPVETNELETFFETNKPINCEGIAQTFGIDYTACKNENEFLASIETFFDNTGKPRLMELFTPNIENGIILKQYFDNLKK